MFALHRRVGGDEDTLISATVFDKVTVPCKSMWPGT